MHKDAQAPERLKLLLAALAALVCSLLYNSFLPVQFVPGATAFEWPTADQFFTLERATHPDFLPHDFMTNSSSAPSPRMVHIGLVLGLAQFFGTDYYSILFCMKAVLLALLPGLMFYLLASIPLGGEELPLLRLVKYLAIAVGVALCQWPPLLDKIVYAFWRPLPLWGAAQTTSFACALAAWLALRQGGKPALALGGALLVAATMLHGANTMFISGFMLVASESAAVFKRRAVLIAVCVLPAALLADRFLGSGGHLSGAAFVELYVKEAPFHRHHYLPELYRQKVLYLITACFAAITLAAWLLRARRLAWLGAAFAALYLGACLLQYLTIYVAPVRSLALLGPVRFTQLGYFMLVLLGAGLLMQLVRRFGPALRLRPLPAARLLGICMALLACWHVAQSCMQQDDPLPTFRARHAPLFDWMEANSAPDDIFAVPLDEGWEFLIMTSMVGRRGVFYAGFMAFSDQYFAETMARKNLLYGSYREWAELGVTPGEFYCSRLDKARIEKAAQTYALQWVLMPNSCMNDRLTGLEVAFRDEHFSVLQVGR